MAIKKKSQKNKNSRRKKPKTSQKQIQVNFAELSEASKRSRGAIAYYETYEYECIACGKYAKFPARLQKQWYEEKKKYFWMRPNKCYACYQEWLKLKSEIATFPELLRRPLTIPELTEMLAKIERFKILNSGKLDWALYNRVKKILQSQNSEV